MLPPYSSDIVLSINGVRGAAVFHVVAHRGQRRHSTRMMFAQRVRRRRPRSAATGLIDADAMTQAREVAGHVPKESRCCGPRSRRKRDAEWSHLIDVALPEHHSLGCDHLLWSGCI